VNIAKVKAGKFLKVIFALGAFLMAMPVALPAQFKFITNNGAITITGYAGEGGAVTIPSTLDGYPVMGIAEDAFYECSSVTSLTVSDSVTCIGDDAFMDCSGLTNVVIGSGVASIGNDTFGNCMELVNVSLPNSLTNIGDGAFAMCGSLTSVVIPDRVSSIGEMAFAGCDCLRSVARPESLTSVGDSLFDGCLSLTSVAIPNRCGQHRPDGIRELFWPDECGHSRQRDQGGRRRVLGLQRIDERDDW